MRNGSNWFINICFGTTLVAMIFFGIVFVIATDRNRYALEELKRSVDELHEMLEYAGPVSAAAPSAPVSTAANAKYYDKNAVSGGRIIRALASDVENLNPLINNDATVSTFWALANSSLAETDYEDPDDYQPMLAESWSLSDDKMTWHIKLRKGVLWHDFTDPVTGKEWKNVEVTAKDFKFYVDAVRNPDTDAAPIRGYLSGIREIRIINDYEFDIVWNEPYFLSKSISLGMSPLPSHLYASDGNFDGKAFNNDSKRNRMIIGCGPYQFVRWEKGKRFVFKRFNKYFGRSLGIMPPIRDYVFEIIQHPSTRLQALVSGDVDCNTLTPEQWINNTNTPDFAEGGKLRKIKSPSFSYNYIGLNQALPLFQDRRVRVALSHLVDRKRILKDVYHDLARCTSGSAFMDGPGYDKSIEPYPFDVAKAKSLLAEAGWKDTDGDGILDKDGKPFKFTLMFPSSNSNYVKLAPILKEDFAKAGVQLELLSLEWSVVVQRIEQRKFEASMMGWTTPIQSDPYQLWHSDNAKAPGSSNYISFSNPEADRLIGIIRSSFDAEIRNDAQRNFHRLLHEEQPYLFLFSPYSLECISSRYRNVHVFPTGIPESLFWVPKAEQKSVPGL